MKDKKRLRRSHSVAPSPTRTEQEADPLSPDEPTLLDRPDGVYWQALDGGEAFGPFESHELARADYERSDEERPAPGETLEEAEGEVGINGWIDAETGEPAQGQSPPHLQER